MLFVTLIPAAYAVTSDLVFEGVDGKLVYMPFAMQNQSNAVNILPDWSHAGYKGGGVAIPTDVPVESVVPDDFELIQDAIDYVESLPLDENGFRGAVLIKQGNYEVNGTLTIEASGVVLRGEGQGRNGTVIKATQPAKHNFIKVGGKGGSNPDKATRSRITTPYVAVGDTSFEVESTLGYSVGDDIVVRRTPNNFWIQDLGMDASGIGWTPDGYTIDHERVITAISGNTITIDIPIVDVMEDQYGGGEILKTNIVGRISQCGVENLRLESIYASNTDENHGWVAVTLKEATNCWVRKVTAQYFAYGAVKLDKGSKFITVEECAMLDYKSKISGGRRYGFLISKGVGNLIQRSYTNDGRHDYVTGSRVTGPNVFLDSYAADTNSDIGPHHRWATGTLFDNIRGGEIRVRNRTTSGTGHGWAGAQTMFWNLKSYKDDIWVDSPKGSRNWGIGNVGVNQTGSGYWEHWNTPVTPRSLYLKQLEDRLGSTAVNNVTIPEQRTGTIWGLLADWAGEGPLVLPPPQNPAPVTGVSVFPTSLSLTVSETDQLTETVSPSDATDKSVTWTSSDTSIATVNSSGLVTAQGEGSATITVTTVDGGFTDYCNVTVTPGSAVTNVALNKSVTVSSEQTPDNVGSKAVDGIDDVSSNRWSASGFPQWLEVDLGAVYDISRTEVVAYQGRAYQFIVESKETSGDSYSTIVNELSNTKGGTSANPIKSTFSPVSARYVRITVRDASGYSGSWVSLQEFRVFGSSGGDVLDFNNTPMTPYSDQDGSGTAGPQADGATFAMQGNRWLRTQNLSFDITPDTVLEFDFNSTSEGEVHGIGFDEDNVHNNAERVFQIFGTQAWQYAIANVDQYTTADLGSDKHFRIPVGNFYTGTNMQLVFVNDKDSGSLSNTSAFRNVRVYEESRDGIYISKARLKQLPMSGAAWEQLKRAATGSMSTPDLSDRKREQVTAVAKALYYQRTGDATRRREVRDALEQVMGTEGKDTLATCRGLGGWVVAADLIDLAEMDPGLDGELRAWLRKLLDPRHSIGNRSLVNTHEMGKGGNNWGTAAGFGRAAAAAYLGDAAEIEGAARAFMGYLGHDGHRIDPSNFRELWWQCDPDDPVGINPKGCTKDGRSIDGVIPDDQRRGGDFTWPPPKENYVYTALQGVLPQAVVLYRAGYDTWSWGDQAILRAYEWLYDPDRGNFPANDSDDSWTSGLVDYFYCTQHFRRPSTGDGKLMDWSDWTHAVNPACP